ncbi:Ldh family oxidoreductase [Bauldia litoralis]|uniref:Malate/lactate/ureidoglycolate dehydrogenase, LDH2 family n=1 Tax=Bauldia litoralis TaxID=665467 RepID=A0A1G6DQB0_9HYPH|nr:Ldh family oxidoreductase [Bauldia litoralis]SDB47339.1 Malate/lactate/ureidoglycolate dehydrogenase, LDH2 family [Bauldia litoralis]
MTRYRPADLVDFTAALFAAAGMDGDKPATVAELLVEADLMGHDTHGLNLAPNYLRELENGEMRATGDPEVLSDHKAALLWDARRLSGVWITARAIDEACNRASDYGVATVSVRESHHIACLAAYLTRATNRGQVVLIACSDPAVATVAPHGGLDPVFTPDPFAAGFPTEGDPILIDMSSSITTNGMAGRLRGGGEHFPGKWAQDHAGNATNDPRILFDEPKGTLLPTGGHDHGHKGYGMALIVESLSQGLSGDGRSSKPSFWGAAIFIQVFEPDAFAGRVAFNRETSELVSLCHGSRPAVGIEKVRLPGERALARKRDAMRNGLALYPGIVDRLEPWAEKYGVPLPQTL